MPRRHHKVCGFVWKGALQWYFCQEVFYAMGKLSSLSRPISKIATRVKGRATIILFLHKKAERKSHQGNPWFIKQPHSFKSTLLKGPCSHHPALGAPTPHSKVYHLTEEWSLTSQFLGCWVCTRQGPFWVSQFFCQREAVSGRQWRSRKHKY